MKPLGRHYFLEWVELHLDIIVDRFKDSGIKVEVNQGQPSGCNTKKL